jgi:hypothetical protein
MLSVRASKQSVRSASVISQPLLASFGRASVARIAARRTFPVATWRRSIFSNTHATCCARQTRSRVDKAGEHGALRGVASKPAIDGRAFSIHGTPP